MKKVAIQNGRKVSSGYVLEVQPKEEQKTESGGDVLKKILLKCVQDGADVLKHSGLQFDLDAVQKLSVALLIARTRAY